MELGRVTITKDDLDGIPEDERFRFLQILNFLNDINVLQKSIVYSVPEGKIEETDSVVQNGQNTLVICLTFVLIGKLCEGWKIVRKLYYETDISENLQSKLSEEGKRDIEYIERFFEENNWFKKIRNNISSHYGDLQEDRDIQKRNYDGFSIDEEMFLYVGHSSGNWCSTTQLVILHSVLKEIHDGSTNNSNEFSVPNSLGSLFNDTTDICSRFQSLIQTCLIVFIDKYFSDKFDNIEIPDPPRFGDFPFPFFVRPRNE